jgi:SAM-dependent methyltransferase
MLFEGRGASSRPWSAAASTRRRSALAFVKHHLLRRGGSLSASTLVIALFLPAVCLTASFAGPSQEGGQIPEPRLNQPGKDVQWVPTPPALVEKMLDLAQLTPQDRLVDLGSGDGVLVIAAARRGIRARGIEYDRNLVEFSKRKAAEAGVSRLTRFVQGDIFKTSFSEATVVTTFLLPSMNLRLRPTFLAMKPGTRIIANTFGIADWQPDDSAAIEPCERWCTALLWIVPAHVAGTWRTPKGDLTLTQKFQMVSGTLGQEAIENGRLRGDEITFSAGHTTYTGRVDGSRMQVSATVDGRPIKWTAMAQPTIGR